MNDAALFTSVERIAGCGPIGCFHGVIYRFEFGAGHSDRWHSDMDGDRLVAFSVNLGRERHNGARLQIADAGTLAVQAEVENTRFGRAVLFQLSERLRHRVTGIEPGPPRTVFTGWFRRRPVLADYFRGDPVKKV